MHDEGIYYPLHYPLASRFYMYFFLRKTFAFALGVLLTDATVSLLLDSAAV